MCVACMYSCTFHTLHIHTHMYVLYTHIHTHARTHTHTHTHTHTTQTHTHRHTESPHSHSLSLVLPGTNATSLPNVRFLLLCQHFRSLIPLDPITNPWRQHSRPSISSVFYTLYGTCLFLMCIISEFSSVAFYGQNDSDIHSCISCLCHVGHSTVSDCELKDK